jgi:hypothetical protein
VVGCCEHCNELSGSIKGGEFKYLSDISFARRTVLHGVGPLC